MFQPIRYLRPNECPRCGKSTLKLVDIDVTVYNVDSNGILRDHHDGTIFYLYCNRCKKKYEVDKRGMAVSIKKKDTSFNPINPMYE